MREPVIIELSNYVKPPIVERMGDEWVLNGEKNSFFDYIVDRYNGSPTNGALVDAYIDRIYGKGLSIVNAKSNASEYAKLLSILPKKEVKKIVADMKLYGSAVGQVRYSKASKRTIAKIEHIDRKMVAPNKMVNGEIPGYWVCDDWSNTLVNKPKYYPRFGTSNKKTEIFEIKPYCFGKSYFADPDYVQVLQWAMLEEEIANFSVNHIKNGLSAGYILNFNDGIPSEEKQEETERQVKSKLTGSNNAAKIVLSWNDNKDTAPTVEPIPVNASHEQWQFWAGEARQQIMTGHRITTPMLVGVKDNTGFGNNANEMQEGSKLLNETTIRPIQNEITDALEEIVMVNGITSPLVFVPLEDEEEKDQKKDEAIDNLETKEVVKSDLNDGEELKLQVQLCEQADELIKCADDDMDEWECIDTVEVDYELEEQRDKLLQLASTGMAIPNARSEQDSPQFKVRYQYAPLKVGPNSREFCKKMVSAAKVYRKEDIIRMGSMPVNPGFGIDGAETYSIWLYKGGPRCHHKWLRKTYVKKSASPFATPDVDVRSPLAETISTAEARRRGDRTVNEPQVSVAPKDMPNEGFYTRLMKFLRNG